MNSAERLAIASGLATLGAGLIVTYFVHMSAGPAVVKPAPAPTPAPTPGGFPVTAGLTYGLTIATTNTTTGAPTFLANNAAAMLAAGWAMQSATFGGTVTSPQGNVQVWSVLATSSASFAVTLTNNANVPTSVGAVASIVPMSVT